MASINGISIKELKRFSGPHGEHLYCGDVYRSGTRLGSWTQKAVMGKCSDIFRFDTKEIGEEMHIYIPHLADPEGTGVQQGGPDAFMRELVCMTEAEEALKADRNAGAALCVAGYGRMTVSTTNEKAATQEQKNSLMELFGGFCVYRFREEMPEWACRDISAGLYCRGDFDPVYSMEGYRYPDSCTGWERKSGYEKHRKERQ